MTFDHLPSLSNASCRHSRSVYQRDRKNKLSSSIVFELIFVFILVRIVLVVLVACYNPIAHSAPVPGHTHTVEPGTT